MEKYIIGVDIGGTWIRVAVCTADLIEQNIKLKTTRTLKENKFSITNTVKVLISELMSENNIRLNQIIGIGLASAGPIDLEKGELFNNVNLGFKVVPLRKPLEEKYPEIPIYLINDCNGAVLGVHYFEAEDDEKDNLVYVTMSTGVGGGVICNGHLILGKEGNAAEVGHVIVEPQSSVECNCGAHGCWEAYSSGTGIRLRALDALKEKILNADILMDIVKNDLLKITAKEVFQAAREGDELSQKIVDDCVFYTKIGTGAINNFYDSTTIYFGGAMMNDKEQIILPLIEQFKKDPIKFTINHPLKIKVTGLGDEVGLRGALALVKYKTENNSILH